MKPESPKFLKKINSLSELISRIPLSSSKSKSLENSISIEDIRLCNRYDTNSFFIHIAKHWLYPYFRIYKRYLQYLSANPEMEKQNKFSKPKNPLERKLLDDFEIYRNWKKDYNAKTFFWSSIFFFFGGVVSAYYNTNIRMPEVYAASVKLFPEYAKVVSNFSPPPFPGELLQIYSSIQINTFYYIFFFIPFALMLLVITKTFENNLFSQDPPLFAINSKILIITFFLILYFPIWRIISERPTYILEILLIYLLTGVGFFAFSKFLFSTISQLKSMINISDSIVVVNLMDIFHALQEEDLSIRRKKISRTVARTKHYLWFLKIKNKTNDRVANLELKIFFSAFSNMLSLVVANNALQSEKTHLTEEIGKIIYASVTRKYRNIERDLPSSYRKAVQLANMMQQRRYRIIINYFRPILGFLLTIIVYAVIRVYASSLPGLITFIGELADIRGLFGW